VKNVIDIRWILFLFRAFTGIKIYKIESFPIKGGKEYLLYIVKSNNINYTSKYIGALYIENSDKRNLIYLMPHSIPDVIQYKAIIKSMKIS